MEAVIVSFVLAVEGEEPVEIVGASRAVVLYTHAVTGGKACTLFEQGDLPEMPRNVIAEYAGRGVESTSRPVDRAGYRVLWGYAMGQIESLSGLDALTEADAEVFARQYENLPLRLAFGQWSEWASLRRRRLEMAQS